ncbi:Asp-tRNA(Asn)/Glu-tRNA(Gln) amidotransferase subunit GatB [Candidatus Kaiserbacteria bacterium]|nr:Asp-tRNA(Asn)/Glu-tRNA(Gln) amidotransferase subunit GatB [Candidatus Kaiserbacteria bacterium]
MAKYIPTIGLEIHAELKTATKMFCASKNDASEIRPNSNVCPVCMAHPGTLPTINKEAVRHVLRVGIALGATLADYTEFDRKNYFYPDLPKGYQLSQYEYPLVRGGSLSGIQITRVHLEEDTASSIHDEKTGATLVDYNRAGVPLMELVTEPVIHSAKDASDFGRELQLLLRTLGVSDADMEKGNMRLEANISLSDTEELGTKVEIKNINSFRAMERAVEYEIKRQTKMLENGEKIIQETRGWDEVKQATFSQRVKEGSADYRYFPDPDLPSLQLSEIREFAHDALRSTISELPWQRRARYVGFGIKLEDAALYVREPGLGSFFEEVVGAFGGDAERIKLASNYIANDLVNLISSNKASSDRRDRSGRDTIYRDEITISAGNFKKIISLLGDKKISSRAGKDILAMCLLNEEDPEDVARKKGLFQDSGDVAGTVSSIIKANPTVVANFKAGKTSALEYLVGQGMKALKGAGDPVALREAIERALK